jgi:hypothetical protein
MILRVTNDFKLALTSPTRGDRSVGIVRLRTKATEFSFSPLKVNRRFYLLHANFLLGLFFDPEDQDYMFLRNVGWLSTDYKALEDRSLLERVRT